MVSKVERFTDKIENNEGDCCNSSAIDDILQSGFLYQESKIKDELSVSQQPLTALLQISGYSLK